MGEASLLGPGNDVLAHARFGLDSPGNNVTISEEHLVKSTILLVLLAGLVPAVLYATPAAGARCTVRATATDSATGRPVAATVGFNCGPWHGLDDSVTLKPGSYILVVRHPDYYDKHFRLHLSPGAETTLAAQSVPIYPDSVRVGTVTGTVTDMFTGESLGGNLLIWLGGTYRWTYTERYGDVGRYSFRLSEGQHELLVSYLTTNGDTEWVNAVADSVVRCDIEIEVGEGEAVWRGETLPMHHLGFHSVRSDAAFDANIRRTAWRRLQSGSAATRSTAGAAGPTVSGDRSTS